MYSLNVALRDPKVKRTRGKLHMMAHDNLATRGESVKRGGGRQSVGAALAVSLAIGHNPGRVATQTQDTSKLALILPTSEG